MTQVSLVTILQRIAYRERLRQVARSSYNQAVRRYYPPETIEYFRQAALEADEKYAQAWTEYEEYFDGQEK